MPGEVEIYLLAVRRYFVQDGMNSANGGSPCVSGSGNDIFEDVTFGNHQDIVKDTVHVCGAYFERRAIRPVDHHRADVAVWGIGDRPEQES